MDSLTKRVVGYHSFWRSYVLTGLCNCSIHCLGHPHTSEYNKEIDPLYSSLFLIYVCPSPLFPLFSGVRCHYSVKTLLQGSLEGTAVIIPLRRIGPLLPGVRRELYRITLSVKTSHYTPSHVLGNQGIKNDTVWDNELPR